MNVQYNTTNLCQYIMLRAVTPQVLCLQAYAQKRLRPNALKRNTEKVTNQSVKFQIVDLLMNDKVCQ